MDNLDSLFQIVLFVMIAVGWAVKTILENRKRQQRRQQRGEVSRPPVDAPEPQIVRVVPTPMRPMVERTGSQAHEPGRVLHSSRAAVAHGAQDRVRQRASVFQRLSGGANVAPGVSLTRAGLLWSEILGPCRALAGPHRSPPAKRQSRR